MVNIAERRQLADLATLLGLMQAASKLSAELDALANEVGGSLEKIAERFGLPFFEVHQAYAGELNRKKPKPGKMSVRRRAAAKA